MERERPESEEEAKEREVLIKLGSNLTKEGADRLKELNQKVPLDRAMY